MKIFIPQNLCASVLYSRPPSYPIFSLQFVCNVTGGFIALLALYGITRNYCFNTPSRITPTIILWNKYLLYIPTALQYTVGWLVYPRYCLYTTSFSCISLAMYNHYPQYPHHLSDQVSTPLTPLLPATAPHAASTTFSSYCPFYFFCYCHHSGYFPSGSYSPF